MQCRCLEKVFTLSARVLKAWSQLDFPGAVVSCIVDLARIEIQVLAKAEWLNPGGSIKDRAALGLITAAERRGTLKPGGTVVEGASHSPCAC